MSLKRSNSGGRGLGGGGGDAGGKVDRQELFDELKRLAGAGDAFTPVDIALAIGAGEPLVSKALLGLAAEGYLERVEGGQYRAAPMGEMTQAEFVKAYARASKVDSTRQRDLSEIGRLKQNNDVMRQRLLTALAERDHYLGVL
jgi:DNA-binding GntR family transcriptional regulator